MDGTELIPTSSLNWELTISSTGQESVSSPVIAAEDGMMKEAPAGMQSVGRMMLQEHTENGTGGFKVFNGTPGHIVRF